MLWKTIISKIKKQVKILLWCNKIAIEKYWSKMVGQAKRINKECGKV